MKEIVLGYTQRCWLHELLSSAIKESKSAVANERLWANGAPDEETAAMHLDNAAELDKYVELLESLKARYPL